MNRIRKRFDELKVQKKKAFIVYITCGDPSMSMTERLALEFDRLGVDILELGIPFSDPIADGPTIQAASQRALRGGADVRKILGLVRKIRRRSDIPIAFMTYYNPVYIYGVKEFIEDAARAGADGIIVPDLPPEEARGLILESDRQGFEHIFLLSPTSSPERIRLVSRSSSGFVYYVSLTGVTGARRRLPPDIADNVRKIKKATRKPVCVGFGISHPKQARAIAKIADGVIVGSAAINVIEKNLNKKDMPEAVAGFVKRLIKAVKAV